MILKIVGYGHPALRNETAEIPADFPDLQVLIDNMFETMYNANGVGLAAPQVGLSHRMFVIDGEAMEDILESGESMVGFKKVFINAEKIEETGREWKFEEGCLSIPDIREEVQRPDTIRLRYEDENREVHEESFTGMKARIIQHEYDHIEGVLFTDYLSGMRKRMLKNKLKNISIGNISASYPMKFKS